MKPFINSLLCGTLLWAVILPACAAQPQTPPPAARQTDPASQLKAWDKNLKTLSTSFTQTTSYDGVIISRSHGKLYYRQDGSLLRLDTLSDENQTEQSAVTDKKTLYVLDAEGKNITTLAWQDWVNGQPNKALFDFGNYCALLAEHDASVFENTAARVILKLTPKSKTAGYTLYLTLDAKDFFPSSIVIESDLMRTQADLQGPEINRAQPANLFKEVLKK